MLRRAETRAAIAQHSEKTLPWQEISPQRASHTLLTGKFAYYCQIRPSLLLSHPAAMFHPYIATALPFILSLLVACFVIATVSILYLAFVSLKETNATLKHPYLTQQPFNRYPLGIRGAILLDYFLRLFLPNSTVWLAGHANILLAHVNPKTVPLRIRWPLLGLWGACLLGIVLMIIFWSMMLLGRQ
ncbi:hypothetical protein [Advenella mimigardefordensis]|nr:hypothetical protein [Advenella mimigardefordensis]